MTDLNLTEAQEERIHRLATTLAAELLKGQPVEAVTTAAVTDLAFNIASNAYDTARLALQMAAARQKGRREFTVRVKLERTVKPAEVVHAVTDGLWEHWPNGSAPIVSVDLAEGEAEPAPVKRHAYLIRVELDRPETPAELATAIETGLHDSFPNQPRVPFVEAKADPANEAARLFHVDLEAERAEGRED